MDKILKSKRRRQIMIDSIDLIVNDNKILSVVRSSGKLSIIQPSSADIVDRAILEGLRYKKVLLGSPQSIASADSYAQAILYACRYGLTPILGRLVDHMSKWSTRVQTKYVFKKVLSLALLALVERSDLEGINILLSLKIKLRIDAAINHALQKTRCFRIINTILTRYPDYYITGKQVEDALKFDYGHRAAFLFYQTFEHRAARFTLAARLELVLASSQMHIARLLLVDTTAHDQPTIDKHFIFYSLSGGDPETAELLLDIGIGPSQEARDYVAERSLLPRERLTG